MKKRIFSVVIPLLLVCVLSAQAAQAVGLRVVSGEPKLSFRGATAVRSAICQGSSANDTVEATLTLYQGDTYIDSWSESGIRKITLYGECKVTSGKTYRLEMAFSVNGVDKPSVTVTNTCK